MICYVLNGRGIKYYKNMCMRTEQSSVFVFLKKNDIISVIKNQHYIKEIWMCHL